MDAFLKPLLYSYMTDIGLNGFIIIIVKQRPVSLKVQSLVFLCLCRINVNAFLRFSAQLIYIAQRALDLKKASGCIVTRRNQHELRSLIRITQTIGNMFLF